MGQVTIVIDKREYAIKCGDGEEGHIVKLSRILDEKARMLSQSVGLINENMMLAMVGLILADELEELKSKSATPAADVNAGAAAVAHNDAVLAQNIDSQVARISSLIKAIKEV